jgi:DNA-directed RNA polymerase specialized sigma24 family protein
MDRFKALRKVEEAGRADRVAAQDRAAARSRLKAVVHEVHTAAGLSYREIARRLGMHRNTVESWFPKSEEKH